MASHARTTIKRLAPVLATAFLSVATGYALRTLTSGQANTSPPDGPTPGSSGAPETAVPPGIAATGAGQPTAELISEALAAAGGAPSVDMVLASRGFDRYEALARFLVGATAADCEEIYTRLEEGDQLDHHSMDAILLRWAEVDPEGARKKNSYAGVWAWAKDDPEAAFGYGLGNDRAAIALRAIGQSDGHRGLELLRQHPEAGDHSSWEGIVGGLAKVDRRAAIEFALRQGVDFEGTMKSWVYTAPDAAVRFTLGLEDVRQRKAALGALVPKLAETDPHRAVELVDSLPAGDLRDRLRNSLLESITLHDPAAAIELAGQAGSPEERRAALEQVAESLVHSDPDGVLALIVDPQRAISPSGSVTRTLAHLRPVESLEAGVQPRSIAREWVRQDPETASTWIAGQDGGGPRNQMVLGLIDGITENTTSPDFRAATAWVSTLDENLQGEAFDDVFSRWYHTDQEAATEAAQNPEVPQSVREELAKPHPYQPDDPFGLG